MTAIDERTFRHHPDGSVSFDLPYMPALTVEELVLVLITAAAAGDGDDPGVVGHVEARHGETGLTVRVDRNPETGLFDAASPYRTFRPDTAGGAL